MPPKFKFTREEIIKSGLDLVREKGADALTARGLAEKLGSSSKPIFGLFRSMEELREEIILSAERMYAERINTAMSENKYPPYKASGMAYILFAKEEKELFRLLFMRDRSDEKIEENREEIKPLLEIIIKNTGLSEDEAYLFHLEMWIFVHGMATMAATSYLEWDVDFIDCVLSDAFEGIKYRFKEGKKNESNKNRKADKKI